MRPSFFFFFFISPLPPHCSPWPIRHTLTTSLASSFSVFFCYCYCCCCAGIERTVMLRRRRSGVRSVSKRYHGGTPPFIHFHFDDDMQRVLVVVLVTHQRRSRRHGQPLHDGCALPISHLHQRAPSNNQHHGPFLIRRVQPFP